MTLQLSQSPGGRKMIPLASFFSEAGLVVAANTPETLIGEPILVPGGLIEPGDIIRIVAHCVDSAAAASQRALRCRISASLENILNGAAVIQYTTFHATNTVHAIDKPAAVVSANSVRQTGIANPTAITSTAAHTTFTTPDLSSDTWLALTVQNSLAAATHTVYQFSVYLEKMS